MEGINKGHENGEVMAFVDVRLTGQLSLRLFEQFNDFALNFGCKASLCCDVWLAFFATLFRRSIGSLMNIRDPEACVEICVYVLGKFVWEVNVGVLGWVIEF